MRKKYTVFANIIFYQLVWFGTVLGGQNLLLPLCGLVALHVYLSRGRREELLVMGSCASLGLLADVLLTQFGVYQFNPAPSVLPVPIWLVVLWLAFVGTFRLALNYFMKRPLLAVIAAVTGAPVSYLAAARLGAVSLPYGSLHTAVIIAVVWLFLMTAFVLIVRAVDSAEKTIANELT